MKATVLFFFLLVASSLSAHTDDSLSYNLYKDKIVLYSDLGFGSAPFNFKDDFIDEQTKLKFRHNQKFVLGLGMAYKWFSLRLGIGLPGTLRSVKNYGNVDIQDLGLRFTVKKTFWDFDFRTYKGFVIKNAYHWNDTLNALNPNAYIPGIRSTNLSVNSWYLNSKNFKMQSVLGQVGDFNKSMGTWYVKGTINYFTIANENGRLTPDALIDSSQTRSFARTTSAMDVGLVPGLAYAFRKGNWQLAAFGGLGGVIQSKFYTTGAITRGFLGLAPRLDLRFIAGYSKPNYFIWFTSEFDLKSTSFKEMKISHNYHLLRLVAGIRINKKKKN